MTAFYRLALWHGFREDGREGITAVRNHVTRPHPPFILGSGPTGRHPVSLVYTSVSGIENPPTDTDTVSSLTIVSRVGRARMLGV